VALAGRGRNWVPRRVRRHLGDAEAQAREGHYDYNVTKDYQCVTLLCLVDTDPPTNFPYVSSKLDPISTGAALG
jgi:hypothetical protein